MNIEQLAAVGKYELPAHIAVIDAQITEGMTPEQLSSIEFQFRVIYTLAAASKTQAHFQFVSPESAEGKELHNVLSKRVAADDLYPHKPSVVAGIGKREVGAGVHINRSHQGLATLQGTAKEGETRSQRTRTSDTASITRLTRTTPTQTIG